jgi:beta-lactamase regulating signal transducer with metallopeptidase domain/ABC-type Fe3+ transport system substrate-binding protein
MLTLLLDHLWQSTLFALAIALLAWSLRKNGAHVRYWLWLTASVKFLVPFSLLTFAGSQIGSGEIHGPHIERLNRLVEVTMAPASARGGSDVPEQAGPAEPAKPAASVTAVQLPSSGDSSPFGYDLLLRAVGIVWLAGACGIFLLWLSRWLEVRRLVRNAAAFRSGETHGMPIPVLETPSSVEPGIAGIFSPVLLLPKGISGRLSSSQFRAVLAHEFEHWRRRDNLTASIQMVVEALFWFHPLVWWIGAQLVREREEACDESVLRQTGAPHDYAEGILNICQHYVAPPLRSAAISGGDLRQRIQRISTNLAPESLGMAKKFILGGLAVAMVGVPVLLGTANAASVAGAVPPADRASVAALYQAAQLEGEVTVMVMDPRDGYWLPTAFKEKFPGIQLRVIPVLGHLPQIIADAESGRPSLDVVMTSLMEGNTLDDAGFLANMDWTPFNVPASHIALNGRFAYTNNFVFTFAYDERRVGKQELPQSWRELLGPQYRGTMSTNPFVMPRILAGLGLTWGPVEAERFARQIKDQDMLNQFGDVKPYFLDESSPRRYFIGMVSTVTEQWEKQQVPSGYVVPEPVIMEQQGTAVLATAPHPAGARLLAGWLATEEAKAIRTREAQSADLLPGSSDPLAVALRTRGVPIIDDTPATTGERAKLAESYQPIFNLDPYYNPYARRQSFSILQLLPGLQN